tara:strand:- start:503 stop:661 length:159 start_codon:yes stop_codon:yes gene_type:complete
MIICLASYPKRENTWLRMLLKSYFQKLKAEFRLVNKKIEKLFRKEVAELGYL